MNNKQKVHINNLASSYATLNLFIMCAAATDASGKLKLQAESVQWNLYQANNLIDFLLHTFEGLLKMNLWSELAGSQK